MKSKARYEARKLWEKVHEASLLPGIQIHHKDGNPFNNSIENLIACTPEEHVEFHKQLGHKIQPNFIARADAYDNLTEEEKVSFKAKCSAAGKLGRGIPKTGVFERPGAPLEMIEVKTGKIIAEFKSLSDAERQLGIQRAHIRRVIKKERKAWHDYDFRYKTG